MSDTKVLLPHVKLQFNIEHPTLEESYLYGYECAKSEVYEDENPFAIGSKEYEHWADGWWAGFYNEEPLFKLDPVLEYDYSANDNHYHIKDDKENSIVKFFEISGMIVISVLVSYQLFELVA